MRQSDNGSLVAKPQIAPQNSVASFAERLRPPRANCLVSNGQDAMDDGCRGGFRDDHGDRASRGQGGVIDNLADYFRRTHGWVAGLDMLQHKWRLVQIRFG